MRSPAWIHQTNDDPTRLTPGSGFAGLFTALHFRNYMTVSDSSPQLGQSDGLVYRGDFDAAYGSLIQTSVATIIVSRASSYECILS